MKRFFKAAALVVLAWIALIISAHAQTMIPGVPMTPLGFCQLSPVSSTGLASCSGGIPAGANTILMQAATANVSWRDDGTAPTSTVGMQLVSGQIPIIYNGTLSKLLFISASGVLNVSFYKVSSP